MEIFIIVSLGIIGGYIAKKIRVPAGAMLGAIFIMIAYNYFFKEVKLPNNFRVLVQILTGAYIGSRIRKEDVKGFRYIVKPAFTVLLAMGVLNFIMIIFMVKFTDMDFVTAAFATSPGGLSDITIIAYDFGADVAKITILQLIRLLSVIIIIPTIVEVLLKKFDNGLIKEEKIRKDIKKEEKNSDILKIILTFIIAIIGGVLGYKLNIPAGPMTFSMAFTAIYNITFKGVYFPIKIKDLAQVLAGVLIGTRVTVNDIFQLKTIGVPVFIVVIGFILMNIILGILLYKTSNFNLATSFFSASPGGMSNISIIAEDFGADTPKVTLIQLTRLIGVVAFYPIIVMVAIKLLNLN